MIPDRYPAPGAQDVFSDASKFWHWKQITDAYAHYLIEDSDLNDTDNAFAHKALEETNPPTPEMVGEFEQELGHDVVAFLAAYSTKVGPHVAPFLHCGMTSSDLVEYGLYSAIAKHVNILATGIGRLNRDGLTRWSRVSTLRPGRTHGQIADNTTWSWQMHVISRAFHQIRVDLHDFEERTRVVKAPGPTGWPDGNRDLYTRGMRVADELNCYLEPATQVIHRDLLLQWAALYLRLAVSLENLALQVRLSSRADVAEVAEGAGESRVGSSAMPHKHNPIDSEKVCGMARVARGYFLAISEDVALWEDRDLSNSSLERIAVPGLAAVVEHMLATMIEVMANLQVDHQRMLGNAADPRCRTNIMQVVAQELFSLGPVEASKLIRTGISKSPGIPASWMADVFETLQDRGFDAKGWEEEVTQRVRARF